MLIAPDIEVTGPIGRKEVREGVEWVGPLGERKLG